jgi:hypothetical protein
MGRGASRLSNRPPTLCWPPLHPLRTCRDWGTASDDGDDAGEGGERGVDLGELPDANQRDELLQG